MNSGRLALDDEEPVRLMEDPIVMQANTVAEILEGNKLNYFSQASKVVPVCCSTFWGFGSPGEV